MAAPLASSRRERSPGGASGGGWRAFLGLPAPSLCWEFLRRNPDYRADYERSEREQAPVDRRWGLAIGADPQLDADSAGVVWRADVAPGLVVPMAEARAGTPWPLPPADHRLVDSEEGRHLRLRSGLQLLLRDDATPKGPLVVVLAYDADFSLRVKAVEALRRATMMDEPPRSRLSPAQRARLARALGALDGASRGASYRDIAVDLFGEDQVDRSAFKTSSLRDVTIRLVRRGRALVAGGYLRILRAGF